VNHYTVSCLTELVSFLTWNGTRNAFATVKFENIMWESPTSDQIKVIDFGLSKYSKPGEKYMYEGVGTVRCLVALIFCRPSNALQSVLKHSSAHLVLDF
jgi:hypothetical protein